MKNHAWILSSKKASAGLIISMSLIVGSYHTPTFAGQEDIDISQMRYRHIGPIGNRVSAVVGIPGDSRVYYAGAASGGIWKSTDGGSDWFPIFDDQPAQSIGSLAVAASDPNVVWAGTGETFIRSNVSIGNGIYRSTDAGKTWKHMGLEKTGRIGRILIDPRDPNVVFAAAMGHCYGPQPERGVFRTQDGGKTWERVLFLDEDTGCSDMAMDPDNPRILLAGMWPLIIRTWGRKSGGPGGGLYMSKDGGSSWTRLSGGGLPGPPVGKVAVGIAPDNPDRMYALIETEDGVLWRSDDGGDSWMIISHDHNLTQRPHYYSRFAIAPDDSNEIYTLAVRASRSYDGGRTFTRFRAMGGDHHDMWIDPTDGDRMILGNDQYVAVSVNRGESWLATRLPIAQMYHVAVDNQIPYYVYGNRQDGFTFRGPSNSLTAGFGGGGIPSGVWHAVGANESGFAIPDPVDNNIVWANGYDGRLDRFDLRTFHYRSVDVWPECTVGAPAADLKYRFQWTFPIAISPHDHNKVYTGSQHVHQTTDGGHTWSVISPDLSTNDKSKQQDSGGLSVDNHQVDFCCVVFAVAESPLEEGVIWAGTNDGQIQITRNGGETWINVTDRLPGLPPWGTVSNVEPSRHEAGTCYLTVDLHQVNNRDPFVYKTSDYGETWKLISSGIPKSVFSYAHCVREDPVRKGLLYVGTENALYASFNDGAEWLTLQSNLPHATVHWMVIQDHFNDLVVGTYGRGFWILDDITPFQNLTADVIDSEVYLFPPRPAYRFQNKESYKTLPHDLCRGDNPPYGASINYYFKSPPTENVKLSIMNDKGEMIRTLSGPKNPGINRLWWDLRHEPQQQAKLRTKPAKHPHVTFGPEGWRPLVSDHFVSGGRRGPLVPPGVYTVRLTVGDRALTQQLTVKKDPHSAADENDIRDQHRMAIELRDEINAVVDMIDRIEWIRKQLYDLFGLIRTHERAEAVITAGKELDRKLIAVEERLFAMHELTGGSQDAFRTPHMLWGQLCSLLGRLTTSDFPPTSQMIEMHEIHKQNLADYQTELARLLERDLQEYNQLLRQADIPNIVHEIP